MDIFHLVAFLFCMQATLKPYLNAVRQTLNAAMCVENFNSQVGSSSDTSLFLSAYNELKNYV